MDHANQQILRHSPKPAVVAGTAFAQALNEGLMRAARPVGTGAWRPTSQPAVARQPRSPRRRQASATLDEAERGRILARFQAACDEGTFTDSTQPGLAAALQAFARRLLLHAAHLVHSSQPNDAYLPHTTDLEPRHLMAAVALLYECTLTECATSEDGSDSPRELSRTRALALAIRAAGISAWSSGADWSESRRLARQLHDELASPLAVALHRVELAERTPERAHQHLGVARRALDEALAENRKLIEGLRTRTRVPRLEAALKAFLADMDPSIDVDVQVIGDEMIAPERSRRELLLILREALRNCFAHAEAQHVEVAVRITTRWVYARVQDDGLGFTAAPTAGNTDAGHGLAAARERAESLAGRLRIASEEGQGTRLEVHLPLSGRS